MNETITSKLKGIRVMPIGSDLILKGHPDHADIVKDGRRLAEVLVEAAGKYRTPLAAPVMDLTLEKHAICSIIGIPKDEEAAFHFIEPMEEGRVSSITEGFDPMDFTHMRANIEAVRFLADNAESTGLIPVGMGIGPFSLTTKLMKEPITPVYMLGMGLGPEDDPMVGLLLQILELSFNIVRKYVEAQLDAGAKIIFIAEPAANVVYISPKQLETGSDIFERVAMDNLRKLNTLITSKGADLFFHCCGELTDGMVGSFASLKPAVMSLGSSRDLAKDSALVDPGTILFGNLPSKKFYSDGEITREEVYEKSMDLLKGMQGSKHAYILGSECDVLSVNGCESIIMDKVMAMMEASSDYAAGIQAPVSISK